MRTILEIMKQQTLEVLKDEELELLGISSGITKDEEGKETPYVRLEVECPKTLKPYARCRFSIKIPECTILKVTQEELEEETYYVSFDGLTISFIDSRGNVYFRAEDYDVKGVV